MFQQSSIKCFSPVADGSTQQSYRCTQSHTSVLPVTFRLQILLAKQGQPLVVAKIGIMAIELSVTIVWVLERQAFIH